MTTPMGHKPQRNHLSFPYGKALDANYVANKIREALTGYLHGEQTAQGCLRELDAVAAIVLQDETILPGRKMDREKYLPMAELWPPRDVQVWLPGGED